MNSESIRIQGRRARFGQGLTRVISVCLLLGVFMAIVPGHRPSANADSPSVSADPQSPATAQAIISWEYDQIRPPLIADGLHAQSDGKPSSAHPQAPAAAQPIISTAEDQLVPAVAYSSSNDRYLVVWEDHYHGADWDVYGQLVGSNGTLIGSTIGITYVDPKPQLAPDVAYNSSRTQFLVVWEQAYSTTDHDVWARRVGTGGSLDGDGFAISTYSAWETNPVVAYNSYRDEYLVVWELRVGDPEFGQRNIYARRLDGDGTPVGNVIILDAGTADQRYPAVAYNSAWDEYLVVWQDRTAGNWDIMGRRVDGDGTLLGGEFTIEAPGHDQTWPDIAFNNRRNEYLIVWEDQIGGSSTDWDIKAWRRNIAGSAIDWYLISSSGTRRRMKPAVAYKYEADEYLVTYEYEWAQDDLDLRHSRLQGDGVARQTDIVISQATGIHEARPAVASDDAWSNLVVWEDWRNVAQTGIDIYGDLVKVYGLSGSVYGGLYPDTGWPLAGVSVALYCSNNAGEWGTYLEGATTDSSGSYTLVDHGACEYYNIREYIPSGYQETWASSTGGTVLNYHWIQYTYPLEGKTLSGNNFWVAPQAPAAPTSVAASDGTYTDRVRVTYSGSSGAAYYEVYRATSAGGTKSLLGYPTGLSWDDTTAAGGTTYYYWVKACNNWLCSGYSAYDTGYRSVPPPPAPTNVEASDGAYTDRVRVTWSSSSGATYYQVWRAGSATGTKTLLSSPTGSPYDDTGATAGTTYYYWLRACHTTWGCSGYSAYDTGYRSVPPPPAPTNVAASDGAYTDRVRVTWSSSSGATYYQVWRAESAQGAKTLLSSPTGSPYDDTGATAGTTYYYWLRACHTTWGCSGYSAYDTGYRSVPPPPAPTNVAASDGAYTDRVEVTWDSAVDATYYEVYRAESAGGAKSLLGSPTATSYDDDSAVVGTTYYYWGMACNSWGCSDYSAYDTGYRSGVPPEAPASVLASDGTYTETVRVTWDSAVDATYYEVYRAESEGGAKSLLGSPTATSYDDTTAAAGTTYYYWLVACHTTWGCSGYSDFDTGYRSVPPPPAPTNVAASDGTYTDRVEVTWDSSSGVTYYEVYRAESEEGTKSLLGSPTATSYDDDSAVVGTTYYYWVMACNSWGCSDYSAYDMGYRSGVPPEAPANVLASDGTYTETVRVTWDSAVDATYYEVYRAESAGGAKSLLGSPTATSYDDTTAAVGTTYWYWVVACSSWGCSDYSAYDTGYRSVPPPAAPTNVEASDGTYTDRVEVTWESASGATYYEVYRAESEEGTKSLLGSPTATSYDDTGATAGTTYYYWLRACSSWGCSDYSAYDTGYRSVPPPAAPTNVEASDGTYTDRVEVTWDSVADATYYEVYRAESEEGTKSLLGSPTATSYDDTTAAVGTTYWYWVVACNTWGCSEYSAYDTGYRPSSSGAVSGRVILERRVNWPNANAGVAVRLADQLQVTGDDGTYSFSEVPVGTHQISATHPSYLPTWRNVEVTAGATTTLPDVTMLGGDCGAGAPQGEIYTHDGADIGLAWDSSPGDPHWNPRVDIRDDQVIDVLDLTAVKFNWLQSAPGPWPGSAAATQGDGWQLGEPSLAPQTTAQATIVVSPTLTATNVGLPATVEIWVQDAEALYAGGFLLDFDPSLVQVQDANPFQDGVQIESGSWLQRQLELANSVDNTAGEVDFAVTQSHPETGKDGSGILARITFVGMAEGISALEFDRVELGDDEGSIIPASAQDGEVVVRSGFRLYLPLVLRDSG